MEKPEVLYVVVGKDERGIWPSYTTENRDIAFDVLYDNREWKSNQGNFNVYRIELSPANLVSEPEPEGSVCPHCHKPVEITKGG